MRPAFWWVGAALILLTPAAPPASGEQPEAAARPAEARAFGCGDVAAGRAPRDAFDRSRAALAAGAPLKVLFVGSSSTSGVGAGRAQAYPARAADLLAAALQRPVDGLARGVGGETAAGAVARLEAEIAAAAPDLLVWQVGANDPLRRRIALGEFAAELKRGIALAEQAEIDLVLVDSQFFPKIADDPRYAAFQAAVSAVAARRGLGFVGRFARMSAIDGLGALEPLLARDAFHMSALGHECLAQDLAATVARGIGAPVSPW